MNDVEMSRTILDAFADVDVVVNADNSFFFYNPDPANPDHMFPFATLMVNDVNDDFSGLNRPGAYRLNMGVSKQTFKGLFGDHAGPSARNGDASDGAGGHYDFTAFDRLMPHPVYGMMYWVCVLNPSAETFATRVQPLLREAYEMAVCKRQKKAAR